MGFVRLLLVIFISLCTITSCKSTTQFPIDAPIPSDVTTTSDITTTINLDDKIDNNADTTIKIGDIISGIQYDKEPYYYHPQYSLSTGQTENLKSLLQNVSLNVYDIDDTYLYIQLVAKYSDSIYKIPHKNNLKLEDYCIFYDSEIDYEGNLGDMASRVSIRNINSPDNTYELGYIFADRPLSRDEAYEMDYFFIPINTSRYNLSEIIEDTSFYAYGANEDNNLSSSKEIYAKLCLPDTDNQCIAWEYYFGSDSEGNDIGNHYEDANKEYMEFDIDENCEVFYLEQHGYRKITLKELHSFNLGYWNTNLYLLGITDNKIVYIISMFES